MKYTNHFFSTIIFALCMHMTITCMNPENNDPMHNTQTVCCVNQTAMPFVLEFKHIDICERITRTTQCNLTPPTDPQDPKKVTIHVLTQDDGYAHIKIRRRKNNLALDLEIKPDIHTITITHADENGFLVRDNLGYCTGTERSYEKEGL